MENKKSKWKTISSCLAIEIIVLAVIINLSFRLFKSTRDNVYNTVEERFTALYGAWGYRPDISRLMEETRMRGRTENGAGAIIFGMNSYYKAALGPNQFSGRDDYEQEMEDYKDCIRVKAVCRMPYYTDGHEEELKLDGSSALLSFIVTEQNEGDAESETVRKEYIWDLSRYLSEKQFNELVSFETSTGELHVLRLWGYRDADGIVPTGLRVRGGYNDYPHEIQFVNTSENATLLYEKGNSALGYAELYICRQSDEWKEPSSDKRNKYKSIFSDRYYYEYSYSSLLDDKASVLLVEKDDTTLNFSENEPGSVKYEVLVDVNLVTKRKVSRKILLLALWGQLAAFCFMLYDCVQKREHRISKEPSEVRQFDSVAAFMRGAFVSLVYSVVVFSEVFFCLGTIEDAYFWLYLSLVLVGYLFCIISLIGFLREGRKQRNTQNNPTES